MGNSQGLEWDAGFYIGYVNKGGDPSLLSVEDLLERSGGGLGEDGGGGRGGDMVFTSLRCTWILRIGRMLKIMRLSSSFYTFIAALVYHYKFYAREVFDRNPERRENG
ncbi:hypothetical protein C5167_000060 [Papaver somniferum]|uniref:Uncharacterized protein n=1 Tax=Papaver somniferum TaxID=3469 RepID=A0A4Y7KSN8_PAPSO|nr:hypothetical protein C5167_000060 [Papaver somniferum]